MCLFEAPISLSTCALQGLNPECNLEDILSELPAMQLHFAGVFEGISGWSSQ